jgi:hypothetical protein
MRFRTAAALLVSLFALSVRAADAQRSGFPHQRHAKLFPSCAGCHDGILTGVASRTLPAATVCKSCHNGKDVREVVWTGARANKPATNVRFSHLEHAAKTAERGGLATCTSCHASEQDTTWMHIRPAQAAGCITCHRAPEHLAETASCRTCHATLVEARELTVAQIAAFPKPASHAQAGFASTHAPRDDAAIAR